MGFGPIDPEDNEPVFHDEWERRVFAVTLAMGFTRSWNLDQSRFARESLPPGEYLQSSYYQIWMSGLEKLMLERELVRNVELKTGRSEKAPEPVSSVLSASDTSAALSKGGPVDRASTSIPLFDIGDRVIARNMHPTGHTRLPRYLRGHVGTIDAVRGCHVFPDSNAAGKGEDPQWLYSVAFSAAELWGVDHPVDDVVLADCWEPYLDSA